MKCRTWLIICLLVLCFGVKGLEAKKIVINGNEEEKTLQCAGDEVVVSGNGNIVKIKGECSRLYVPGNENTVKVQAVGAIDTPGNENRVIWEKALEGSKPSISNLGTDNTIKKAATRMKDGDEEGEEEGEEEEEAEESAGSDDTGVAKRLDSALSTLESLKKGNLGGSTTSTGSGDEKAIILNGNNQTKTFTLQGEKVIVNGNFLKVTIKGTCGVLQVNGNSNEVHVAAVGTITANGNLNKIFWQKGIDEEKPAISNVGTGNKISHEEE